MRKLLLFIAFAISSAIELFGQQIITGKVYDSITKEPLPGATILLHPGAEGTLTNPNGHFTVSTSLPVDTLVVSFTGYAKKTIAQPPSNVAVALVPSVSNLQQVMITANREAALRTESPVAISKVSAVTINDTKAVLLPELINKIPGVVMLNYNNEQHAMSVRQPMGTSPYYLYLEDGVPIRPMGIFNHNALIETNLPGISSIEVIKGPASSLYGPESVGGAINIITQRPTTIPTVKLGVQADQWGYQRLEYAVGGTIGEKLGIFVSGFEGRQRNSWQTASDYDKSSLNAKVEYLLDDKTRFTAAFSGNEYYSDMAGSVDSLAFYNRAYSSTTDFTYRKVHAQRTRLTVSRTWDEQNETHLTLVYRDNYIEQNPNYAIRWTTASTTASGERNRNSFCSKVALLQHTTKFSFLNSTLLTGGSVDYSPANYWAYKIDLAAQLRADGRSVEHYTIVAQRPDVYLSNYVAKLENYATYAQFDISPLERLKITLGLRYDKMVFDYHNYLDASFGRKSYGELTPKIGATFDLLHDKGVYANYSKGFSPPGLTSIFRKRPMPPSMNEPVFYYDLAPARFNNFEVGGWGSFAGNKVYVDLAIYQMRGRHELLHVRQQDNSVDYQSAGKTLHRGIEYGITYRPGGEWLFRFGGTNAVHRFDEFDISTRSTDEIKSVDGKDMPQSPRWIANSELTYKPAYLKGLRLSLEWQRIGSWYEDQINSVRYDDRGFLGFKGVSYVNLRSGYEWKSFEIFLNVLNLTDELYANSATKGNAATDRTAFTPAAPRTFVGGLQYTFTGGSKAGQQ